MKFSTGQQQSLVQLLLKHYDAIFAVESDYGLVMGGGDMRARIDYFHDAIRAFTTQNPAATQTGGRLTIEWLAYDVSCLRYLQANPLGELAPYAKHYAAHNEIIKSGQGLMPHPKTPTRDTKQQLGELYKTYGVLFAALLKPFADNDYYDRMDALNEEVTELNQQIQQAGGNKQKISELKQKIAKSDKDIKIIDKAHHSYATAQLGLYEAAKDMLKKMAQNGMNLVGQFVESSLRSARRERSR